MEFIQENLTMFIIVVAIVIIAIGCSVYQYIKAGDSKSVTDTGQPSFADIAIKHADDVEMVRQSEREKEVCSGCGRTKKKILDDFDELARRGALVLGSTALLYCPQCKKYFCGRCQVDLGWHSGCPVCKSKLD